MSHPYPISAPEELRVSERSAQQAIADLIPSGQKPWFHDPAAIRRLARGGRSPTAAEKARSNLPRVPDDHLLNAIEGFATLILTSADLPPHIGSLSLEDLLVELSRRGTRATNAGRLMALAGEAERLTRLAEREAALEEPEEAASRLGKVLYQVRSELGRRLERLLRRTPRRPRDPGSEPDPATAPPPLLA